MLNGIPKIISPDLLLILARMGHGDEIVLADANFPGERLNKNLIRWDGRQPLTGEECKKIKSIIDKAHSLGKPFRFWGIPDTPMSWETFYAMGLDFINTDDPVGLSIFMDKISKR